MRTLLYGEGIFETILWQGRTAKLKRHYRRLKNSAEFFQILCPDYETLFSASNEGTSKSLKFLQKSEKDKAENVMITDMMRNDIGRIAEIGSVKVTELFKITKYRTLYQMHSTVEGITNHSILEIIKETFPPASVTGAPKRKAVEMIDTLEPHSRGYYCGAGGLVKNETDFTLSVLIRTAVGIGNGLSYYAGCGIVWGSDPERELEELYLKMKAFYER